METIKKAAEGVMSDDLNKVGVKMSACEGGGVGKYKKG